MGTQASQDAESDKLYVRLQKITDDYLVLSNKTNPIGAKFNWGAAKADFKGAAKGGAAGAGIGLATGGAGGAATGAVIGGVVGGAIYTIAFLYGGVTTTTGDRIIKPDPFAGVEVNEQNSYKIVGQLHNLIVNDSIALDSSLNVSNDVDLPKYFSWVKNQYIPNVLPNGEINDYYTLFQLESDFEEFEEDPEDIVGNMYSNEEIDLATRNIFLLYIQGLNSFDPYDELIDFQLFSIDFENEIIDDQSLSSQSKAILLSAFAAARYSSAYWWEEE